MATLHTSQQAPRLTSPAKVGRSLPGAHLRDLPAATWAGVPRVSVDLQKVSHLDVYAVPHALTQNVHRLKDDLADRPMEIRDLIG